MYESLGIETLTAPQAAVWFGLFLGLAFGVLAQVSRFCLRRGLVAGPERRAALGTWTLALAIAVIGTQALVLGGFVDFSGHRFQATELPLVALTLGGLMFGAGMVLARGCLSRLTVLTGAGNLRALAALLVAGVVAHATMRGVLAPLRTALSEPTLPVGGTLGAPPGGAPLWAALLVVAALAFTLRSGARPRDLALAVLIGALVPLGWVGTGYVLYDDFDPIALESLAFTGPSAETLFYVVTSTAISPTFGTGLLGGVIGGALLAALATRSFRWEGFEQQGQTARSLGGAALMGFGGVLAGGCTVGAGLSGLPTLGLAALIAFAAIVAGALATDRAISRLPVGYGAPAATRPGLPAE